MFCCHLSWSCQKPVGIPTRSIAHCLSLLPYSSVTCFIDCLPFHLLKVSHTDEQDTPSLCSSLWLCSLLFAVFHSGSISVMEASLSSLCILQEQVLFSLEWAHVVCSVCTCLRHCWAVVWCMYCMSGKGSVFIYTHTPVHVVTIIVSGTIVSVCLLHDTQR